MLFANALVLAFSATGIIVAKLKYWDILIVAAYDIVLFFVVDALKVSYQAWLKSSGVGNMIEDSGKGFKRESGSFIGNRCCDLLRCIFCLQNPLEGSRADNGSLNDSTSEAIPLSSGSSSSSLSSSGVTRRGRDMEDDGASSSDQTPLLEQYVGII